MGGAVSIKSEKRGAGILTVVGRAQLAGGEGLPNSQSDAARLFALAADEGDAHGICALADCYMNGWGVQYQPSRAFHMYTEAASLGYAPAMHCLGLCYRSGVGTTCINMEESFSQFRKAATDPTAPVESMHELGVSYLYGLGTSAYPSRGIDWLNKACSLGYSPSANTLRNYYQSIDLDVGSLSVIEKAANNGDSWAMNNCGVIACRDAAAQDKSLEEENGEPKDKSDAISESDFYLPNIKADPHTAAPTEAQLKARKTAEKWFRGAIALDGLAESKLNLGIMCIRKWCDGGSYQGLTLIHEAATEGLPAALAALGTCYKEGYGVQQNLKIATRLFREGAKLNCTEAQERIGESFFFGKGGMKEDIVEAAKWLGKAAAAGRKEAQARLGKMLISGELPESARPHGAVHQGLRMLQSGSRLGSRSACHALSECYEFGLKDEHSEFTILDVDLQKAQKLMARAEAIGSAEKEGRLLTLQEDGFEFSVATPTLPPTNPREIKRRARARKKAEKRMTNGGVYDRDGNSKHSTAQSQSHTLADNPTSLKTKQKKRSSSILSSGITTPRPMGADAQAHKRGKLKRNQSDRGKPRRLPIPPLPIPDSATPELSLGWSDTAHGKVHGPHGPALQAFGMLHAHCFVSGNMTIDTVLI